MNFKLKKSVIFVMVFAMVASMFGAVSFAQEDEIRIVINGEQVESDVAPQLVNNRTLVPIRVVSESLGADVRWDQSERVVYINSPGDLSVGGADNIQLVINGGIVETDVAPQLIDNRTMVPIRVVSENLNADVNWDQAERVVTITSSDTIVVRDAENPDRYPGVEYHKDELLIHVINYEPWEMDGAADRDIGNALKAAFPDLNIRLDIWGEPVRDRDLVHYGVNPDIVITTAHNNIHRYLISNDWAMDMEDMIADSSINLDELNQGAVEMVKSRSQGGMYGVPLFIREYVMMHNNIALNALEVPEEQRPRNGMTWDEIYDLMEQNVYKGSGGARNYRGLEVQPTQYLQLNQMGLHPYEDTGTWTPNLRQIKDSVNIDTPEWLELMQSLYDIISLPGNAMNSVERFYQDGNVTLVIDNLDKLFLYSGAPGRYKESDQHWYDDWIPRTDIGVTSVPVFADAPEQIYMTNLLAASVTKDSDKKEDAMRVIEWLASEEGQLEFSRNGIKAVLETDEIVEQFAVNIPEVAHLEGLGEAVYWGENASPQNYERTDIHHQFSYVGIFQENIINLGLDPQQSIDRFMYDKSTGNGHGKWRWYGWDDQVLYDEGLLTEQEFNERNPDRTLQK